MVQNLMDFYLSLQMGKSILKNIHFLSCSLRISFLNVSKSIKFNNFLINNHFNLKMVQFQIVF